MATDYSVDGLHEYSVDGVHDYSADGVHDGTVSYFTLSHGEYFDKVSLDVLVCIDHQDLLFVRLTALHHLELREVVWYLMEGVFDCDLKEIRQQLIDWPFDNFDLSEEEIEELTTEAWKTLSFVSTLPLIRLYR